MIPGTKATSIRRERGSTAVTSALGIHEGEPVVVLDRMRTADGRPMIWSLDFLPVTLLGEHAIEELLEVGSIYRFLDEQLRLPVVRGVAEIYPCTATAEMAPKLSIKPGTALLRITQADFSPSEQPVLYSIEYHVSDAFVFVVNRKGPSW